MPKVQTVLELANYKVGDIAWWVTLRPIISYPSISEENQWMKKHHPKSIYSRGGPYKKIWDSHTKNVQLPKLQHLDFKRIVNLLTSRFVIEKFLVCDIVRSNNTGEFFYSNHQDEWMPESYLLDSKVAARRERQRILQLIKKWTITNEGQ